MSMHKIVNLNLTYQSFSLQLVCLNMFDSRNERWMLKTNKQVDIKLDILFVFCIFFI
jgi:hypothetical protein